jgi:hypothetical protein
LASRHAHCSTVIERMLSQSFAKYIHASAGARTVVGTAGGAEPLFAPSG